MKVAEGTRKNFPTELFLENWRRRLLEGSPRWQGRAARAELQRKQMLDFLLLRKKWKRDWRSRDLVERILAEVKRYQHDTSWWQKKLRPDKHAVTSEVEFLRKLEKRLKHRDEKTKILVREVKDERERLIRQVANSRTRLQMFVPAEKGRQWTLSPLGLLEGLWPNQKYKALVKRGIDMDTRLQLQLGKIFSIYLRQDDWEERQACVSLSTVSRLILLVYWVADLAESEGEVQLRTKSTRRLLKVRNITDVLNAARLKRPHVFGK